MVLALVILVIVVLCAFLSKGKSSSGKEGHDIKSGSFSDELYDYSMKSKGKLRNPHMSIRAMRHRIMKKR
jgi:hypothetical protein